MPDTPPNDRTANPIAVEWQVLFDEEPEPGRGGMEPEVAPAPGRAQSRSLRQWSVLLLLLALVSGYLAREAALAPPARAVQPLAAERRSADALAAGVRRTILSEHLRISAAGADVATVEGSAAELDRRYADAFALAALPAQHGQGAPDGRLVVYLRAGAPVGWEEAAGQVFLPAPSGQNGARPISERRLLLQSWQLALAERVAREVADAYSLPYGWLPFLGGLRLWLLWDGDGPLADGKERTVHWLLDPSRRPLTQAEAAEMCALFSLWQRSPLDYALPVGCENTGDLSPSPVPLPTTLTAIAPIYPPRDTLSEQFAPNFPVPERARAIALALLFDYTAERYGRASLTRLLAALPAHSQWDSLIPAVYGLSAQEFEAGWQGWLAAKYGW